MLVPLQILVEDVLLNPQRYEWTVHGFGILRVYFQRKARLHIWAPELRYPNVSDIHDHNWDLKSTIIHGKLGNQRYHENLNPNQIYVGSYPRARYCKQQVVRGMNNGARKASKIEEVTLYEATAMEVYKPGDIYEQKAREIHKSVPLVPYTITLLERESEDVERAVTIWWLANTEWGTALPRSATEEEVKSITKKTLKSIEEAAQGRQHAKRYAVNG